MIDSRGPAQRAGRVMRRTLAILVFLVSPGVAEDLPLLDLGKERSVSWWAATTTGSLSSIPAERERLIEEGLHRLRLRTPQPIQLREAPIKTYAASFDASAVREVTAEWGEEPTC